jgi:hypothetical protein
VENWLNSKILDSIDDSVASTPTNELEDRQKSFIDIFIESIDTLSTKINTLSQSNEEFKKELLTSLITINNNQNEKFDMVAYSNSELLKSFNKLIEIEQNQSNILNKTEARQEKQEIFMKDMKESYNIQQMQFAEALSSMHNSINKISKIEKDKKAVTQVDEEMDFLKKHFKLKSEATI